MRSISSIYLNSQHFRKRLQKQRVVSGDAMGTGMELYAACHVLFGACTALFSACTVLFVLHMLAKCRIVAIPFETVSNGLLPCMLCMLLPVWDLTLRNVIQLHNDGAAPELQLHWMLAWLGTMWGNHACVTVLVSLVDLYHLLYPIKPGLSPAQIEALGVSEYQGYLTEYGDEGAEEECCICLAEFVRSDNVRVIPGCRHVYHRDCIDKWLSFKSLCPRCNSRSGLPK